MRKIYPASNSSVSISSNWLLALVLLFSTALAAPAIGAGNRTKEYTWLLFLKVNEPPQVNAGSYNPIAYPTNSLFLNATVTDDPNDRLIYKWSQTSGPGTATFSHPTSVDTTVSFNKTGTYVLKLWASDGREASYDLVTITYNNRAPVVNAGTDKQITYPTNSVFLNATVTDDPNDRLSYEWSKVSGLGTATFSSPTSVDATVSFNKTGTYVLRLRASDGELASTDSVVVKFLPVPAGGNVIVAVGDSITLGLGDRDCAPGDNTAYSCSGYTPVLERLLEQARAYNHTVRKVGKSGASSSDGAWVIQDIVNANPDADQYLVMYGTNEAGPYHFPPIDAATFRHNMQQIINTIRSAGAEPILARIPYVKPPRTYKNEDIRTYNAVIDSLQASPPDFYDWFINHTGQLHSDGIHPIHSGYNSMAYLWCAKLINRSYCL